MKTAKFYNMQAIGGGALIQVNVMYLVPISYTVDKIMRMSKRAMRDLRIYAASEVQWCKNIIPIEPSYTEKDETKDSYIVTFRFDIIH